jgi:leucyl/phenylalanyl-tRNA--protein transferase
MSLSLLYREDKHKTNLVYNYSDMQELDPDVLLRAYSIGLFPMGDAESDEIDWYSPDPRAIIPLSGLKISKSLRKTIKQEIFTVTTDQAFEKVMRHCADRSSTWITEEIIAAYCDLHKLGFGHSVECRQDGELVGGLYGVSLGGAFFGESMFHHVTDASKVALVGLVQHMNRRGLELLDVQFMTEHLRSLGAIEIDREEYLGRLKSALESQVSW